MIYVVIEANEGTFISAWTTPELAKEARDSTAALLSQLGKRKAFLVLSYTLDKINEWEVYYD